MSNFFDEYLYRKEELNILSKAYEGAFGMIKDTVDEVSRNANISKLLTYRRIKFQTIDASEATYTLSSLLNNNSVMTAMGIDPNMSLNEKIKLWETLNISDKMSVLDTAGYSILLTSFQKIESAEDHSSVKFNVVDFEITDINNVPLIRNIDYMFSDNKLFILKEFSVSEAYKKKQLILKNIVIDTNATEDILGVPLNIPYSNEFTKTDYNETLRSFIQAAAGGPTLNKLEVALSKYKVLEGVKVYDKYNAPDDKRAFWGAQGFLGDLTAFDFLVSLPISFLYNAEKLEYITNFFSQIKPAYTNFTFAPQLLIVDKLILKYKKDVIKLGIVSKLKDNIKAKEVIAKEVSFKVSDGIAKEDDKITILAAHELTDKLKAAEKVKLLNRSSACDRIITSNEEVSFKQKSLITDTLNASKTTNVSRYDSIYFCDEGEGDELSSVYADMGSEDDGEAIIQDKVKLRLIPKIK